MVLFKAKSIFPDTMLFALKISDWLSVVPIKLVPVDVPALPVNDQLFPLVTDGNESFLTIPELIVSILSVTDPLWTPTNVKGLMPTTCNGEDGVVVPIPTYPVVPSILILSLFDWIVPPDKKTSALPGFAVPIRKLLPVV